MSSRRGHGVGRAPSGTYSPPKRTAHGNVREAASWVIERTLASRAPADVFMAGALARCDERDHGLLVELVRGTLTWIRRLDDVLSQVSDREIQRIEKGLLGPLRLGLYQLFFLDRVPPHAVVDEAVSLASAASHRGGAGFVNAVLRKVARQRQLDSWPVRANDPAKRLALQYSHPDFLVESWLARFGAARTEELLRTNNRPKPVHLLAFRDRGGREVAAEALIEEGIGVVPSEIAPLGLECIEGKPWHTSVWARGDLYVADEAGQAAALVPPPRPGERILDIAAFPGGKTFAMLAFEPSASVISADVAPERLPRMRENLARLGRRVPVVVQDAQLPAFGATFDRVLVDLPCSGSGTFRKSPELKWRVSPEEITRLATQATGMLAGAAALVRPGGLLVAMSCSIEREENETVVGSFLESHDFQLSELGGTLLPAVERFVEGLGRWRILPEGAHDGFTVHVMKKPS